jgi:hypothetical protein
MMSMLGDKYARYLSPAKYQSLVDSATGTVAGVGVEIATTNRNGQVISHGIGLKSPVQSVASYPVMSLWKPMVKHLTSRPHLMMLHFGCVVLREAACGYNS